MSKSLNQIFKHILSLLFFNDIPSSISPFPQKTFGNFLVILALPSYYAILPDTTFHQQPSRSKKSFKHFVKAHLFTIEESFNLQSPTT